MAAGQRENGGGKAADQQSGENQQAQRSSVPAGEGGNIPDPKKISNITVNLQLNDPMKIKDIDFIIVRFKFGIGGFLCLLHTKSNIQLFQNF